VFSNLRAQTLTDGTAIEYTIDPTDRRIASFTDGAFDHGFVYRDDLQPIARLDASNAVDQRYVYGTSDHVPDYLTQGSTTLAYVADIRGSVRLVVDAATGAVLQRTDYSPFGIATGTAAVQPFGFDGGLVGPDGAVRFGARDYDPVTGRWTDKDPTRFSGADTNLYGYVMEAPVNLVDPAGARIQVCDKSWFCFETRISSDRVIWVCSNGSDVVPISALPPGVDCHGPIGPTRGQNPECYRCQQSEATRCVSSGRSGRECVEHVQEECSEECWEGTCALRAR